MKLALIGESGSGKSTLLELLAMILMPTSSAKFRFTPANGDATSDLGEIWRARGSDRLSELRSRYVGYVLQHGGLLPYLTVRRNIELPRVLLGLEVDSVAEDLAQKLGIAPQLDKLPSALSVGQRQRAAIDPLNSQRIMALFVRLVEELGVTLILATHAHELVRDGEFVLLPLEIEEREAQSLTVRVDHG